MLGGGWMALWRRRCPRCSGCDIASLKGNSFQLHTGRLIPVSRCGNCHCTWAEWLQFI